VNPFRALRRRSLRLRITIAFVAGTALLAMVLSVATLFAVRSVIEDQRIRSSTRQTQFAVLFAQEFLATNTDAAELVSRLQIRQRFDALLTVGDQWYATGLGLTPDGVPDDLRALVRREGFGYAIHLVDDERMLVFGSPLPRPRHDLYLFFPLEDLDRTMGTLGRALAIVATIVVAVMAFLARRLTRGILQPLAAVSGAAQRMAEGLLETRVETRSDDELGQLAASFNQMGEALHDIIRHERAFVAAVSHELRTPLAALNAAVEVVATSRDTLPPDGREALDLVQEDLTALRDLVADLMEVSALDSGHPVVRMEDLQIRDFIEALVARKRHDVRIDGPNVLVHSDKARLERILGNLIDNAFTHGLGREVTIAISRTDDGCAIAVSDRGPGIAPEDMPMIFGRFFKPDQSRTRERGGVGLGLAIAKENAALLGGTLSVTSTPDEGTTFTVTLPRGVEPDASEERP
jgi:two-component system, OmpR family, sensor histidine kinase MtrB